MYCTIRIRKVFQSLRIPVESAINQHFQKYMSVRHHNENEHQHILSQKQVILSGPMQEKLLLLEHPLPEKMLGQDHALLMLA